MEYNVYITITFSWIKMDIHFTVYMFLYYFIASLLFNKLKGLFIQPIVTRFKF